MADEEKQGLDSLNFKLSPAEKKKITDEAGKLDISISEYVRIKASIDENDFLVVREENRKLKKELNEMKVKNSYFKKTERFSEGVTLKISEDDQELLKNMFDVDRYMNIRSKTLEGKIIWSILDYFHNNYKIKIDEEHEKNLLNDAGFNFGMLNNIFRNHKNEINGFGE